MPTEEEYSQQHHHDMQNDGLDCVKCYPTSTITNEIPTVITLGDKRGIYFYQQPEHWLEQAQKEISK